MQQPEVISTEEIYTGRIFKISLATVKENQTTYKREIISHPGSAVILPIFADETFALVRQYRHPAEKYLLELPAGSLQPGEDPELGAKRELEEEIGVKAGKIEKLTEFYVSPGFLGEKMHLFLATDLQKSEQNLEEDEILTIEKFPLGAIPDLILNNTIEDAKTIIGLTLAAARYRIQLI
jgi:ADP-ribose pyrophosphatase